jgi:FG-GAP-like repeat
MSTGDFWDMLILDGHPPYGDLASLAVGDIDGDGNDEIVIGGDGGLLWYRPATLDKGVIAEGRFHVGLTLEDIDGDGLPEIFAGTYTEPMPNLWYKMGKTIDDEWTRHVVDPAPGGGAHDLLFVDIDGDGRKELIANACARKPFGLFIYKPGDDLTAPWSRHVVQEGYFTEGLMVADLNGDGRLEIVHGPDLWLPPEDGPLSGPWRRQVLARGFREMVRVALVDVTGNGRQDVVVAESEFYEGRASWFENRMVEDPANPWIEHPLEGGLYYAHSLDARRDDKSGAVGIFIGEMAEGGWSAPRNRDARLIHLTSGDNGHTWQRRLIYQGSGTHQAIPYDIDGDGKLEIVGKQWKRPKVHIFKQSDTPNVLTRFRHRFLDRDKPTAATDLRPVDLTGDGRTDIVCGQWWYHNEGGDWVRRTIPGVNQVIFAYDIDGDGRMELIATTGDEVFSPELVWLKAVDPLADKWTEHPIGVGGGDWPHGVCMAPVLPGGRLALMCGWHSAEKGDRPELFEVPDDPTKGPWPKRLLADIPYGEEIVAADINGNGRLDLVAGPWWLENIGDGTFVPHQMTDGFDDVARVCVADINGNGLPDVVLGEEVLGSKDRIVPPARLVWLENPGPDRAKGFWTVHSIDMVRCPHSIGVADLDGDGQMEIVCGEHDPFTPYRSRCRLLVYKKGDAAGRSWWRWCLDDRFEHHDGTKVFEMEPGRWAIASHGWRDSKYVHLWEAH